MNFPAGEVVKQGMKTREMDKKTELSEIMDKLFSGYLVVTINGFDGFEEGVLLFRKGILIGAIYEYLKYGIIVYGLPAVPQVINALSATHGVADLISLSPQQADLVVAFNDKLKIEKEIKKNDLLKLITKQYSDEFARKVLSEVLKATTKKEDIFKKLGLTPLS